MPTSKTTKHFNPIYPNLKIKQPLISSWIKDEEKWREQWDSNTAGVCNTKCMPQTQHPKVTEMLELWVLKALRSGVIITGVLNREKIMKRERGRNVGD